MITSPRFLFKTSLFTLLVLASQVSVTPAAEVGAVDFAHEIVPLLRTHCYQCHGGEKAEGGFSINTRELFLESGAVDLEAPVASRILELVREKDDEFRMPPSEKPRVPEEAVAKLESWIKAGLPWEPGFTFSVDRYVTPLKPRRPELPGDDAKQNPIDRILSVYYQEQGLTPPGPLGDVAYLRRLKLDLLGLLPTVEEIADFQASESAKKRVELIDQLLSDRHAYAEHWFTFWNDLLRNDYVGTGYINGGRKHISGWLYGALLENKSYDQFVRELIAPQPEASGFISGFKWRGNVNASQHQNIQFAQNVSQVFLGINMKCASCHDSFVDHWTLEETYGLASIYASEPLETHRCDKPTGKIVTARWIFPELGQVDPEAPQPARLKQLAVLMTHPQNGRLTRTIVNRLWHRMMGRGIVHPVDAMDTEPWNEDLLDYLAVHLADNNYDLQATLKLIATSKAYQSQAVAVEEENSPGEYQFAGPITKRMTAEQFLDSIWQITDTGPAEVHKRVKRFMDAGGWEVPDQIRAALVKSDLLQRSLGRPNREQVVSMRPVEMTMLQALDLSNGEIMADTIQRAATKLQEEWQGKEPEEMIHWLFMAAVSRPAFDAELSIGKEFLSDPNSQQGVEDLLWAVFMLPEFQLIR